MGPWRCEQHRLTFLESQRHRWGLGAILTSDLRFKFSFARNAAISHRFQPAIHRRKAKLVQKTTAQKTHRSLLHNSVNRRVCTRPERQSFSLLGQREPKDPAEKSHKIQHSRVLEMLVQYSSKSTVCTDIQNTHVYKCTITTIMCN